MRSHQTIQNLRCDVQRFLQRKRAGLEQAPQRVAIDQFRDDVRYSAIDTYLMNCKDIRMIQTSYRTGFLQKALLPLRIAAGILDYFDGNFALKPVVPSSKHFAHTAGSQRRKDFVRSNMGANRHGFGPIDLSALESEYDRTSLI